MGNPGLVSWFLCPVMLMSRVHVLSPSVGFFDLHLGQGRAGIPRSALSGYQSFEGFDPAEWVRHDYAIVNVNTRGAMGSQGNIRY